MLLIFGDTTTSCPTLGKNEPPPLLRYLVLLHAPQPIPSPCLKNYPLSPSPQSSPLQPPKSSPSLRNPDRQRRRRKQHARAPKHRHEPKRIIRARVPAILPQRPQARRLLAIHVGAQFAQAVAVDGELGVGDAVVGQLFAGAGPLQEEVGGGFEAEGVVGDGWGRGGGGRGGGK